MSAFEGVAYVLGEGSAYAIGRVMGWTFKIERERTLRIGQYLVMGTLTVGGLVLCLVYT